MGMASNMHEDMFGYVPMCLRRNEHICIHDTVAILLSLLPHIATGAAPSICSPLGQQNLLGPHGPSQFSEFKPHGGGAGTAGRGHN